MVASVDCVVVVVMIVMTVVVVTVECGDGRYDARGGHLRVWWISYSTPTGYNNQKGY